MKRRRYDIHGHHELLLKPPLLNTRIRISCVTASSFSLLFTEVMLYFSDLTLFFSNPFFGLLNDSEVDPVQSLHLRVL